MTHFARTIVVDAAGLNVLQWPTSVIAENLDYAINIAAPIDQLADVVTSASVSVAPSGELVIASVSVANNIVTLLMSGGVPGRIYTIRLDVATARDNTFSWLATLPMSAVGAIPPIPLPATPAFSTPVTWVLTGSYTLPTPAVRQSITYSSPQTARRIVLAASGNQFLQWPIAEPNENLDYYFDASAPLVQTNDAISLVSISVKPSGTGELQPTFLSVEGTLIVDVWFSQGVPGRVYTVKIDVTGNSNRVYSWLVTLPIDIRYAIPPIPFAPNPGFGPPFIFSNNVIELESGAGFWSLENDVDAWVWG